MGGRDGGATRQLKLNGALISRATYARLYAHANGSGNIVSEATWSGGNSGSFSTGDLATTFRLPDLRGEFIRGYDDSRGVDAARVIGARQADSLKDHTHVYNTLTAQNIMASGSFAVASKVVTANTGGPSTGAAAETRRRNVPLLACVKF
jgi:phage-related tail fiber protein